MRVGRRRQHRTYELTIESLSHEGRGVARHDGKTVFVDLALPGETVIAERFRKRSKFDEAIATEIRLASPDRVPPPCPHFTRCGGCALQHMASTDQVAHKQSVLVQLIERALGAPPPEILPALTGPTLGYRHKARLAVKHVHAKGRVLVGFRERRNPFVADIPHCAVLHPIFGERFEALSELVASLSIPDRIAQFEVAVGDEGAAMIVRHLAPLSDADVGRLRAFGDAHGILMLAQPAGPDSVHRLDAGDPATHGLSYRLDGEAHGEGERDSEGRGVPLTFDFLATDFTQVNPVINRAMIARALDLLALSPDDRVLDMFCGLGNFTLPIARRVASVRGVEGEAGLVARARANAQKNRIANAAFEVADLAAPDFYSRFDFSGVNKMLVDPPRTGAAALFETAELRELERIVYVSCNPATLARDLEMAVRQKGFTLVAAGVMDMFPHTAHVESIALLERR